MLLCLPLMYRLCAAAFETSSPDSHTLSGIELFDFEHCDTVNIFMKVAPIQVLVFKNRLTNLHSRRSFGLLVTKLSGELSIFSNGPVSVESCTSKANLHNAHYSTEPPLHPSSSSPSLTTIASSEDELHKLLSSV